MIVNDDNTINLKTKIGRTIKERRKNISMNQEDLLDYAEISPATLSKLEQGKANITIDTLKRVLDVLGLEIQIVTKRVDIKWYKHIFSEMI